MNRGRKKLYRVGIISLAVCFAIFTSILIWQFGFMYSDELFHKNIPAIEIIKLLFFMSGTIFHMVIPLAVLLAAAIYYRYLFSKYKVSLNKVLRKSWPIPLALFTATFLYTAFLLSSINLNALSLLYDLRNKEPDKPIEHIDKELFRGAAMCLPLSEQLNVIDSLQHENDRLKELVIEYARKVPDTSKKYATLNDSVLNVLGIDKVEIVWNGSTLDNRNAERLASVYMSDMIQTKMKINSFQNYVADNFRYPLLAVALFYIGLFLGVLSRRLHILVLILGLNWGIAGVVYVGDLYVGKLLGATGMEIITAKLLSLSFQLLLIIILYYAAKNSLKHWNRKPVLIPHFNHHINE